MVEPRGRPDFEYESVGAERRRDLGLEDFERDFPLVLDVLGQVDRGHATFAEFGLDAVAAL